MIGALLIGALPGIGLGWAQEAHYALPGAEVNDSLGVLEIRYRGREVNYAAGLGWLEGGLASTPVVEGGEVFVGEDVLSYLGADGPRLTRVRSSGGSRVRLVFDFEGLSKEALEGLRGTGQVGAEEVLTLPLPPLLLPRDLPTRVQGLRLEVGETLGYPELRVVGAAFGYQVFPLQDPTRLVIDVTADLRSAEPEEGAAADDAVAETTLDDTPSDDAALDAREGLLSRLFPEGSRTLSPGVTQRRLVYPTVAGESRVDIVEIAPNRGDFRVVGGSYAPRTLSELAGAGLAGINASYFDTEGGRTIGLLKKDAELLSLPTRNRAAIGFGFGRPVIGRVQADLEVRVNGVPHRFPPTREERVALHTSAGQLVGTPRQGAIVVQGGRVLENKVGPRRVPRGGFVLSYAPDLRALALVDTGDTLSYHAELVPRTFNFAPYAVEAGPLLVQGGRPAYRPELEVFDALDPESNVNRRTTRAAIGVKPDGTVLLVTATEMTARELVPLFLDLGAEDALQMDSGGSSTLLADGAVVNRPAFLQRKVATAIVYSPYW